MLFNVLFCYVFLETILCVVMFLCVCFDCKCKSLNRLGENIFFLNKNRKKQTYNRKASRETSKQTEIQDIQPTNLREYIYIYIYTYHIFIRRCSWAGYPVVLFLFCFLFINVVLEAFLFYVCFFRFICSGFLF